MYRRSVCVRENLMFNMQLFLANPTPNEFSPTVPTECPQINKIITYVLTECPSGWQVGRCHCPHARRRTGTSVWTASALACLDLGTASALGGLGLGMTSALAWVALTWARLVAWLGLAWARLVACLAMTWARLVPWFGLTWALCAVWVTYILDRCIGYRHLRAAWVKYIDVAAPWSTLPYTV